MSKRRAKAIAVDTPFDEYEHMRALRCECGGAFSWGERTCEREPEPHDRYVIDSFTLACPGCRCERKIAFRCDTRSEAYTGLTGSTLALAAGLGIEGAAAALAFEAGLEEPEEKPPRPKMRAKRKRRPPR